MLSKNKNINKWKKNGRIKKSGLFIFLFCYLLNSAFSIVFILSRLLKLIPEPTFPFPGIGDFILIKPIENTGIPMIVKIRACILLGFLIFTLINIVAHSIKIHSFNEEIKNEKKTNEEQEGRNSNLKNKRNICIAGLIFSFIYCALIIGDFLATILKIKDIIKNQHFYNSLVVSSIIYALLPLTYLAISFTREIIKCFFYEKIAEDKNSFASKAYLSLSNIEYVTSIFCFFWDIVNWNEIKNHQSNEYFNSRDKIILNEENDKVKEYSFTLFYFMPIKVTKHEIA